MSENKNALAVQVGGDHYKSMAIQPIEFTHRNGLNFCQGNVVKYVTRYKTKNGLEDLKKARHYIDLLIELEYPSPKQGPVPEATPAVRYTIRRKIDARYLANDAPESKPCTTWTPYTNEARVWVNRTTVDNFNDMLPGDTSVVTLGGS